MDRERKSRAEVSRHGEPWAQRGNGELGGRTGPASDTGREEAWRGGGAGPRRAREPQAGRPTAGREGRRPGKGERGETERREPGLGGGGECPGEGCVWSQQRAPPPRASPADLPAAAATAQPWPPRVPRLFLQPQPHLLHLQGHHPKAGEGPVPSSPVRLSAPTGANFPPLGVWLSVPFSLALCPPLSLWLPIPLSLGLHSSVFSCLQPRLTLFSPIV